MSSQQGSPSDGAEVGVAVANPKKFKGLTRRGEQRQRSRRYYVVCPVCGRQGMNPGGLHNHLVGSGCVRSHTAAEAERLKAAARRDPLPWLLECRRMRSLIEQIRAEGAGRPKGPAAGYAAALATMEAALAALERAGPENYEIRDPAHDPYNEVPEPPRRSSATQEGHGEAQGETDHQGQQGP